MISLISACGCVLLDIDAPHGVAGFGHGDCAVSQAGRDAPSARDVPRAGLANLGHLRASNPGGVDRLTAACPARSLPLAAIPLKFPFPSLLVAMLNIFGGDGACNCTSNRCNPEQPQLLDPDATSKERLACGTRWVYRRISKRDANEVNER